jgi:hypothetical protein
LIYLQPTDEATGQKTLSELRLLLEEDTRTAEKDTGWQKSKAAALT